MKKNKLVRINKYNLSNFVYVFKRKEYICPCSMFCPMNNARSRYSYAYSRYCTFLLERGSSGLYFFNEVSVSWDISITPSVNSDEVASKSNPSNDFYLVFLEYLDSIKPRLAISTFRGYMAEISKMRKFRSNLRFSEIDKAFVMSYEHYMLMQLKNKHNTVNRTFRRLKSFFRQARLMGYLESDPFLGYRMLHEATSRESLQWSEIRKLERLRDIPLRQNQKNILEAFLFSCYTGLRYIDIRRIQKEHLVNGTLIVRTSKTGIVVRIPLSKKAKGMIKETNGKLFRLYSNNKTNKLLGEVMCLAGIYRKITFHASRHTFATLSLNMGISMEVVSTLLGHSNIKTTQIYAKILDSTRAKMMKKWDKIN